MQIEHPVSVWHDIEMPLVLKAIDLFNGLKVTAVIENNNPKDNQAVLIIVDVNDLIKLFGGTEVSVLCSLFIKANGFIRIGYLSASHETCCSKNRTWYELKTDIFNYLNTQKNWCVTGELVRDSELGAVKFEFSDFDDGIPY